MSILHRAAGASALLAVSALGPSPALAETVNCTAITSVPYTISAQGIYCLTGDLSTSMTSGFAVEITTNNVVLDLNGHKLGGLSAGPATLARGIYALDQQNITIKNGTVRGFLFGIQLDGTAPLYESSQGHVIEDVRVDQNTYTGIYVAGRGMFVRSCQVVATGGTTAFGPNMDGFGIHAQGIGNRVIDNDVVTVTKLGTGLARGIELSLASAALAVGNRITLADRGITYGGGSNGKYRDNLTSSVATPFTGGTDAGGNN